MQNFVVKKSLIDTLRALAVGESIYIKTRDFKTQSAQNAKRRLRKEGINIAISERGLVDEFRVERLN